MDRPQPSTQIDICDLAIIGAGPVGLYAAFYAGLRQMSVKLIDSLDVLGGQLVTLYPEKYIYDVGGLPKILAKDLAANLIEQGLQYGAVPCLGEQVRNLDFDPHESQFTITTDKSAHVARSVLIAAGIGSFSPKMLPIPGIENLIGHGVYYTVKHVEDYRGKRVLIIGGGDSAVDWANALSDLADSVTLIHRRNVFRAHEDSVAKLYAGKTAVKVFHELLRIETDKSAARVTAAVVKDTLTKQEHTLVVDAILVNIGFDTTLGPIAEWGLEIEQRGIKVGSQDMQTNRPGVYAAGDVAVYPGKLKLIATGFAEAAIAVNNAKHRLDPKSRVFPGHSSEMKR